MKKLSIALWAEYMKIRNSRIMWITFFFFIFIPLMMGLMIYIVRHPEISAKLGIIGTKANMFGNADWKAYFGLLNQSISTIGFIGFGFVASWVFGREFTDRSIKDILALPISRSYIVLAKCITILIWCLLLSLVLIICGFGIGQLMNLSGGSNEVFVEGFYKYMGSAILCVLLFSPLTFFATYGRGIIAPLGFVFLTLIMAQFIAIAGFGAYFPWAIPGLFSAPEGTEGMQLNTASYIIIGITFIGGYLATNYQWKHADFH